MEKRVKLRKADGDKKSYDRFLLEQEQAPQDEIEGKLASRKWLELCLPASTVSLNSLTKGTEETSAAHKMASNHELDPWVLPTVLRICISYSEKNESLFVYQMRFTS